MIIWNLIGELMKGLMEGKSFRHALFQVAADVVNHLFLEWFERKSLRDQILP